MIHPHEALITTDEAAAHCRVEPRTIIGWIRHGVRGVRLEAVRYGWKWQTSHEALARFAARRGADDDGGRGGAEGERQRAVEKVRPSVNKR